MNLTWAQQHPINYQFFRSIEDYLINCPEISNWTFDANQSNVLLGFKLTDPGIIEPVLLNLPTLLKQHQDQFKAIYTLTSGNLESSRLLTAVKDGPRNQDLAQTESLIDQNFKETSQKEEVDQDPHPALEIWKHFENMDDPRADGNLRHKLSDIVTIAILAVICGADHWNQIEQFGKSKIDWLSTFLELPHGIPSHDTFNRLFAALDPDQFRAGFISWINSISKVIPSEIIAIDGKQNRRTHDKKLGRKAIHMVSARYRKSASSWSNQSR